MLLLNLACFTLRCREDISVSSVLPVAAMVSSAVLSDLAAVGDMRIFSVPPVTLNWKEAYSIFLMSAVM